MKDQTAEEGVDVLFEIAPEGKWLCRCLPLSRTQLKGVMSIMDATRNEKTADNVEIPI